MLRCGFTWIRAGMRSLQRKGSGQKLLATPPNLQALSRFYYSIPGFGINQLEAVMVAIGELIAEGATIVTPPTGWQNDKELVRASTGATNTAAMLRDRIARAKALWSDTTQ